MDVGPQRDLARELSDAVRAQNLTQGFYYSLFEWFHPLYLKDRANNFTTSAYVDEIMIPQLKVRGGGEAVARRWQDSGPVLLPPETRA